MTYSTFVEMVESTEEQRKTFFKMAFGPIATGYICISYLTHTDRNMYNRFFHYPSQLDEMLANISSHCKQIVHVYYSSVLFKSPNDRHKTNVSLCPFAWADLDSTNPKVLLLEPSILIQTSPKRFQALWTFEKPLNKDEVEDITQRIFYHHKDDGTDACWDAGHLLRVPYTPNYKYGDLVTAPVVTIVHAKRSIYRPSDFSQYKTIPALSFTEQKTIPKLPQEHAEEIIERNKNKLPYDIYELLRDKPTGTEAEKWSGALWRLMKMCVEAGLRREETFIIANEAACNKYRRDGRPETELWQDVLRAYVKQMEHSRVITSSTSTIPDLMTDKEIAFVTKRESFIERYIGWARTLTDAAVQYHQSGAFMILSALLSGSMKLQTSFGRVIPNLWFMLLANTTITRKTTSMNIAMSLLKEVDSEAMMATDGSLEGLLVGLRDRPSRPSIFLRDEFTGLLEAIAHKDYMAGFAEQLTKLYDGDSLKRLLRKETIDIRDPVFLMYVGGTKSRTQMLLNEEMVMSGFLPRFIIISAEPDLNSIKPVGPPIQLDIEARDLMKNELIDMFSHYSRTTEIKRNGSVVGYAPYEFNVVLTPEAWSRYNELESMMTKAAIEGGLDHLTPMYDRLSKSTLKCAMLIAASRQRGDKVVVELADLLHAIYYSKGWHAYASEIINGIGKPYDERLMMKILETIRNATHGVTRSELMTMFMLDSKKADLVFGTLEQRRTIFRVDIGTEFRYQSLD